MIQPSAPLPSIPRNRHSENPVLPAGSAETLRRAMAVTKLNDMLDCIKDMQLHSTTIEQDIPDYVDVTCAERTNKRDERSPVDTDDFLRLARESLPENRYILLHDLIEQKKVITAAATCTSPVQKSNEFTTVEMGPSVKKQEQPSRVNPVEYMRRIIAAQPTALEAIYLEALFNPEQWRANHRLVHTSPMDILTVDERQRLREILKRAH